MNREVRLLTQLSFEKLKEENIEDVLDIERASFENPWSYKSFLGEFSQSISNNYIAKNSFNPIKHIIAYVSFRIILSEMELLKIAVDKKFRNLGVASFLLNKSLDIAKKKGADTSYLEVGENNINALNFYIKNGYECYGRRANYYKEQDALLLKKELKNEY